LPGSGRSGAAQDTWAYFNQDHVNENLWSRQYNAGNGIYVCENSHPTIKNNIIMDSDWATEGYGTNFESGSGICVSSSQASISYNDV
jgi:hypothetical protein